MGGQVLGGGVIALVAVLLWLVYLVPSWHARHHFNAAERNAVRLNQALRVLAETSETPREVQLELTARTALAQQRLARRAQAERAELEQRTQAERERAELERRRAELEAARREGALARALPASRRARARRRARLTVTAAGALALAAAGWGAWQLVEDGTAVVLAAGASALVVCAALLARMAGVASRGIAPAPARTTARIEAAVQDVALPADRGTAWTPRELPQPLTASAGSRAAAVLDEVEARDALHRARREEALRAAAERRRPPSIDTARRPAPAAGGSDAEIEAHVRELLRRRAAG